MCSFGQLMASYAEQTQADIGLLRGTEGEAVADPRREPRQRSWIGGRLQADLLGDPAAGALATPPQLPGAIDAETTARWIEAVLQGQAEAPYALSHQVDRLMQAFARMASVRATAPPGGSPDGPPVSS